MRRDAGIVCFVLAQAKGAGLRVRAEWRRGDTAVWGRGDSQADTGHEDDPLLLSWADNGRGGERRAGNACDLNCSPA